MAIDPRAPQQKRPLTKVGDFIDSPTGKLATSALGAFLDAREQGKARDNQTAQDILDRQSRERMTTQGQLASLEEAQLADDRARATGALEANPLGAEQDYSARAAFLRNAAGLFNNINITPSDPAVRAAMPQISGGFNITDDFKRQMADAWSPDRVNAAIAQRRMDTARLDPRRGTIPMGNGFDETVSGFANSERLRQEQEQARRREALMRALDNKPTSATSPEALFNMNKEAIAQIKQTTGSSWEDAYQRVTGQQWPKGQNIKINPDGSGMMTKDRGIMGAIGKGLLTAAPFASAAIPGVGPIASAAISAGAGAARGAMDGGGLKGAILGGAWGGLTGPRPGSLGQVFNPSTVMNVAGQVTPGVAGQALSLGSMVAPRRWSR